MNQFWALARFAISLAAMAVTVWLNWLSQFPPLFLGVWLFVTSVGTASLLITATRKTDLLSPPVQALLVGLLIGAALVGIRLPLMEYAAGQVLLAVIPTAQYNRFWETLWKSLRASRWLGEDRGQGAP